MDLPSWATEAGSAEPVLFKQLSHPVWTRHKGELIARYLKYFTYITKHGCYIDAFAGPQYENEEGWAASLVMSNEPRWLQKFHLFEINDASADELRRLCAETSRLDEEAGIRARRMQVHLGDSNVRLLEFLEEEEIRPREATFALLDQRTTECAWETVEALARYKPAGENKIEQFYFFPHGWFGRSVKNVSTAESAEQVRRWWGEFPGDPVELTSRQAVDHLVTRYRKHLKYRYVNTWPIYSSPESQRKLYTMIHATDHPEAPKLMRRAYATVVRPVETAEQLAIAFPNAGF